MTAPTFSTTDDNIRHDLLVRLRRIEGQMRGIQSMIQGGKADKDVLVQLKAARSALRTTNNLVLMNYLLHCRDEAGCPEMHSELPEEAVRMLALFLDV